MYLGGACVFPRQYSFLAWHQLHSHSNYWLVRQPVMRNTHSNSFPCALQSLQTWINVLFAVFFGIEHYRAHTFPSHPCMAGWCNGQEVHTNYMLAPVTSSWRVSGFQTLECDSLSEHGSKNTCTALLQGNLLSLQAQLRSKTTNSQETKWSSLLAQYFLGKPEIGPWPQNHHHHLPRVTQDCQE